MVVPDGKVPGALLVMVATEQLSDVVGEPNATPVALHPELGGTETFAGAVIAGLTVSNTVTCDVHVPVFPATSVTVNTTGFKVE